MDDNKLFNNGYSHIQFKDNSIEFYVNDTGYRSPRSISVYRGLYIELGRPVEHIRYALTFTSLPIVIQKLNTDEKCNKEIYKIIKLADDNDKAVVIAYVSVLNGVINSIEINRNIGNDNYLVRNKLVTPSCKISIPNEQYNSDDEFVIKSKEYINLILMTLFDNLVLFKAASYRKNIVEVIVDADNENLSLLLVLNEKTNRYEFISLSYYERD